MDFVQAIAGAVTKRQTLGQQAKDDVLHVAFGFDAAYVRPMGVALTSIAVNNPSVNVQAHLFYSSLGEGDLTKLTALVSQYANLGITLYAVDEQIITMLPVEQYLPLAIYFRLMMPSILSGVDKVLYLDSDVLCHGDISDIQTMGMAGKIALVVADVKKIADRRIAVLSLTSGKYFNSGVMLIDINKWNKQQISEQVFSLLCENPDKFKYFDQDALNIVLENDCQYIDVKWNFILLKNRVPADVRLLHCAAHPKPWKILCKTQAKPLFLHYENLSPWRGTPLEYPTVYTEARQYSKYLWKQGLFKNSLVWYAKYLKWKCKDRIHG